MRIIKTCLFFLLFIVGLKGQEEINLYDLNRVIEVRLYFEQNNWEDLLDSLKQEGNDDRLIGDAVIDGVKYENAGIRYKGNSSYFNVRKSGSSKLPFNIKVNEITKGQKLPGGYSSLKLSNLFRDPSFLREVLAYEIAGKYMPAPRANFAKLYVNDRYLGLYNNTESVDDEFLDNYFGEHKGVLVKCDPNWHADEPPGCPKGDKASLMYLGEDSICYYGNYEMKSKDGWGELIDLTRVLNNHMNRLEETLDVDQAIWMLAFNNVLVNLDSYSGRLCHNYYIYQDTAGVFHPVVWDMNLCFGGFRYTGLGNPLSNEMMQNLSLFVHYKEKNPDRPLITNLIADDLYRKVYIAHVRTILHENFKADTFINRALEIHQMIDTLVKRDTNKLYSYEAFKKNIYESASAGESTIIGLKELMQPRAEYLINHPLIDRVFPVISEVKHQASSDSITITVSMEGAEKAWLMYRYGTYGSFRRLRMEEEGQQGDKETKGRAYKAVLPGGEKLHYYFIAEGDKVASLLPERASLEYFEASADQP